MKSSSSSINYQHPVDYQAGYTLDELVKRNDSPKANMFAPARIRLYNLSKLHRNQS